MKAYFRPIPPPPQGAGPPANAASLAPDSWLPQIAVSGRGGWLAGVEDHNLRLEDTAGGNHWFLPGWSTLGSAPAWARAIAVRETDIDSLANFEVDLAPWYARGTAEYLRALDVDAALWVCPPPGSWSPPRDGRARAFEPFELPYAELRRAIARRAREGGDAFVKYRDSADGADAPLRTWRIARGQRVSGDPILETPWPWAQDALLRFRSFSSQGSPCRH